MARTKTVPLQFDTEPVQPPRPAKVRPAYTKPPATTGGMVAWRVLVALSTVVEIGFVPPLRYLLVLCLTAIRNLAASHQAHHGKPLTAGPWPQQLVIAGNDRWVAAAVFGAVVLYAVARQVQGIRRYGPNAVITRVALIVLGTVAAVVAAVIGLVAGTDKLGDTVLTAVVNTLSSVTEFVAGLWVP